MSGPCCSSVSYSFIRFAALRQARVDSRVVQQNIKLAPCQLDNLLSADRDALLVGHVELQAGEPGLVCKVCQDGWVPSGCDNVQPCWSSAASASVDLDSTGRKSLKHTNKEQSPLATTPLRAVNEPRAWNALQTSWPIPPGEHLYTICASVVSRLQIVVGTIKDTDPVMSTVF